MSKLKQKSSSTSLELGNTPPLPEKRPNINRTKKFLEKFGFGHDPPFWKKPNRNWFFLGMASLSLLANQTVNSLTPFNSSSGTHWIHNICPSFVPRRPNCTVWKSWTLEHSLVTCTSYVSFECSFLNQFFSHIFYRQIYNT